jgi:hypothetical protein
MIAILTGSAGGISLEEVSRSLQKTDIRKRDLRGSDGVSGYWIRKLVSVHSARREKDRSVSRMPPLRSIITTVEDRVP